MKRVLSLPAVAAVAIGLGAIGFGAGFGVRAMSDDGADESPSLAQNDGDIASGNSVAPGAPKSIPASTDAAGRNGQSTLGYGADDLGILPSCQGDLPVSISAAGIDLAAAGISLRTLGSAFAPVSMSVRAEGDCDVSIQRDGSAPTGPVGIVVDTTWRHKDTGTQVTVSQRASATAVANVIRQGYAQFSSGGSNFTVYANMIYYAGVDGQEKPTTSPASPAIAPDGRQSTDNSVLLSAIRDIAPSLGEQCFAHEVQGDWSNLAALGIGDPRSAVPSDIPLGQVYLSYVTPAAEACGGAALPENAGIQFNANWYGDKSQSSVSVGANAVDQRYSPAGSYIGTITDNYANWQSDGIQFNVYGNKGNGGLGVDTIRKIAKALDPSFDDACFVREATFDVDNLGDFGLKAPQTPSGYKKGEERGVANDIADGCTRPEGYVEGFSYYVQYQDGENVISLNVDRYAAKDLPASTGYIGPNNINWITNQGVNISISGYNQQGKSGGPSLDTLKALARSVDPGVDFSKMTDSGDGKVVPPVPAASSSGSGSSSSPTR